MFLLTWLPSNRELKMSCLSREWELTAQPSSWRNCHHSLFCLPFYIRTHKLPAPADDRAGQTGGELALKWKLSCIWFITLSCHSSPPPNLSQDHNKCHFKGSELGFNCEECIHPTTVSFQQNSICGPCWEWGEHMGKVPWILHNKESIRLIMRLTLSISHKPTCGFSGATGTSLLMLRCVLGSTNAPMLLVTLKTTNFCLVGGNQGLGAGKENV